MPTLFFTLHGVLALVEKKAGRSIGKIPAVLAVILPLGLLSPPAFQNQVIATCLGVFDVIKGASGFLLSPLMALPLVWMLNRSKPAKV